MVTAEIHVHEAGDEIILSGVAVKLHSLNQ
jgi:hypothetical protein